MLETKNSRDVFYVTEFNCTGRETTFMLNQSKDDCNKIVFKWNAQDEIKGIIYDLLNSGRSFDFRIAEKLGDGRCTIDEISVRWFEADNREHTAALAPGWEGPYETHLKGYEQAGFWHYFRVEDPGQAGGKEWLCLMNSDPLFASVKDAFDRGRKLKVMVTAASPGTDLSRDGRPAAVIKRAETLWAL